MRSLFRLAYFGLHRAIGSDVAQHYRELLELERKTPEYVRNLQDARTTTLLKHAAASIPFYAERVSQRGDLCLADFPILTKEHIRNHFEGLMSAELRSEFSSPHKRRGYSWIEVQTGGSTGVPTTVIHSRELRDRGRAARLYSQYLSGFPLGTPYIRLWGSMREVNAMNDSLGHRVASFLSGETVLNAFKMGDSTIESYIALINSSRVQHMMAYADAAYHMSRYALAKKAEIRPLATIMACAGTLTEEMRRTIETAFTARVHNKYGSRDCTEIACECDRGNLHIYSSNIVVEVVDDNGKAVPPGQSGRLLITVLTNKQFPLIRYEIGDIGSLQREACSCGRPNPVLAAVEGRKLEFLLAADGSYVSPAFIVHLIGVVHNQGLFRRYQLVQNTRDAFELNLEVEAGAPPHLLNQALSNIERDLKAVLGKNAAIQRNIVECIAPSASGKFLTSICRVTKNLGLEQLGNVSSR